MIKTIQGVYDANFEELLETSDGYFRTGRNAQAIFLSNDRKIEFVLIDNERCLAGVVGTYGNTTYYQLKDAFVDTTISAVLMDLDGTTADSENFWVEVIRSVLVEILGDDTFTFDDSDIPFISGHSVFEHLCYCIEKYCESGYNVNLAISIYREIVSEKMSAILLGEENGGEFNPSEGLKETLLLLKKSGIKIGLVTSGNFNKAHPEIIAIFRDMALGNPADFYDAIITAGTPSGNKHYGTLGELVAKPHPWLYAEASQIGLGIFPNKTHDIIGIEDSGAGVCALRLAGIPVIGLKNGNIIRGGYEFLCEYMADNLLDASRFIRGYF